MRKFRSLHELADTKAATLPAADPSIPPLPSHPPPPPPPVRLMRRHQDSTCSAKDRPPPAPVPVRRFNSKTRNSTGYFPDHNANCSQRPSLPATISTKPAVFERMVSSVSLPSQTSPSHCPHNRSASLSSGISRATSTAEDVIADVGYIRSIGIQCLLKERNSSSGTDGPSPVESPTQRSCEVTMTRDRRRRQLQHLKYNHSTFLSPYSRLSPDDSSESSGHSFISPSVSPVPWHVNQREDVESNFLNSAFQNLEEGTPYTLGGVVDQIQRRGSTTSLNSDHEEQEPQPPENIVRRGRRAAIYNSKNMIGDDRSTSPNRSPNDSGTEDTAEDGKSARRTSLDITMGVLPGVDMLKEKHKKILKKQNTIADLTARAYNNTSNSAGDDSRKKGGISFLKLIDKKAKSRESLVDLQETLCQLKHSEFRDSYLLSFKDMHWSDLIPHSDHTCDSDITITEMERRRREAVWELFKSELIFLLDHLMVLKHCFLEPLKKLQVDGYLMFVEPQELFGNLDELCYVSYTFCRDLITTLTKDITPHSFGDTDLLIKAFKRWTQHSKDGEVFHNYCLNYDCALTYLDILRKYEQFAEFEKWCEQDSRCHRLQLTDLLVAPMQHCMKTPLLLANIRKYTESETEKTLLTQTLENVENSLKSLEDKMRWLKNFERLQEIQQQLIWPSVMELEPRVFIPEFLKSTLSKQPCERLIANPKRQLLHEGFLTLVESNKSFEVYSFLFDDILLVTRIKKPPKKKSVSDANVQTRSPTEGALFTVHKQPVALDRFSIHDVGNNEATANGLRNAFVLVQLSRFQQIIGVYSFQAPTDVGKMSWLEQLRESQQRFQEKLKAKLQSNDASSPQTNKHSKLLTKIQRMQACKHEHQVRESGDINPAAAGSTLPGDPLFPPGISLRLRHQQSLPADTSSFDPAPLTAGSDQERLSPTGGSGNETFGARSTNQPPPSPNSPADLNSPSASAERPTTFPSAAGSSQFDAGGCQHASAHSSADSGHGSHSQDHSYLVNMHGTFSPPLSPTLHAIMPPFDQTYDPSPSCPRSRSTSQTGAAVAAAAALTTRYTNSLEVTTPRTPKRVSIAAQADEIIPYSLGRDDDEDESENSTDIYV